MNARMSHAQHTQAIYHVSFRFGTNAFSWMDGHPHLAGLIAGIGAWALQLTSIHYIRRRWFDVREALL